MADNKTDDREWGRQVVKGEHTENGNRKRMNRKQVGTLDQFQIPYKRKGQLMADVGLNVM
jgi:hypothetical protein